jgi:uncharacterized protein YndB with AHSA1/START domain
MANKDNPMATTTFTAEPGKQEVVITGSFEASCEAVFKGYTDPKLIPQWWGPADLTTTVEIMEVKPGGRWRFVQRDRAGKVYAFHGVYHTVTLCEKLVLTFEYEGTAGHVILETLTFEEHGGLTRVTDQSVYQSVTDRDGMVAEGMEDGSTESMQRLAALLEKGPDRQSL